MLIKYNDLKWDLRHLLATQRYLTLIGLYLHSALHSNLCPLKVTVWVWWGLDPEIILSNSLKSKFLLSGFWIDSERNYNMEFRPGLVKKLKFDFEIKRNFKHFIKCNEKLSIHSTLYLLKRFNILLFYGTYGYLCKQDFKNWKVLQFWKLYIC